MKLEISESKIRQIVNEEVLKNALTKSIKEHKFPNYAAYLLAEILTIEWQNKLQESGGDTTPSAEWITENASSFGLSTSDVREATTLIQDGVMLEEGIGSFFKAAAAPIINIHKTLSNITKHAANLTDPDAQKTAKVVDQIDDKIPDEKELTAKAKSDPDELAAYLRQIIDLLKGADQKMDLDTIKPGLEQGIDQAVDQAGDAVQQAPEGGAGAEGGGGEAFVYKGKGGKGLQSFLARGSNKAPKLKGKAMGAVLKHIEKQLKAQGVTVSEGILDEIQGWAWRGLVEQALEEQYGQPVTIKEILEALGDSKSQQAAYKGAEARRKRTGLAKKRGLSGPIAGEEPAAEEPAAEEAPIEPVKPTVRNTAPEGSPTIKVFRGKGGEGLQSALAKNRDALGIDQQTVAVIIKSVEDWAQTNQIKVENVSADVFNTIISEISTKYKTRRLKETIQKLKNV